MKFVESKSKSLIYTILIIIFILFEMGMLSGYRFVEIGSAADKYGLGMSMDKVGTLALVGANVGWNYITCSVLYILGIWGFSILLGYNRNPGGLIAIVVMNILPMIGFATNFNFLVGFGYAGYTPAMALFGLTFCTTKTQQITNNLVFALIVTVLAVVCWIIGKKVRASYAAKYEFDVD